MTLDKFPDADPSITLDFQKSRKLDPRITFTRASGGGAVGTGSGNVNGEVYTFQENVPRLTSQGLLVEDDRTNLRTHSAITTAEFTSHQSKQTIVASTETAPDGTVSGVQVTNNTGSDDQYVWGYFTDYVAVPTTGFICASIFVKMVSGTEIFVQGDVGNQGWIGFAGVSVDFSTATPTVTLKGASGQNALGGGAIPYGNGWWRIWYYINTADGNFNNGQTRAVGVVTRIAGTSAYIWGAQIEAGTFPTSYIPTTTAAVTRAADLAEVTGADFASWYSPNESTWVVSGIQNGVDANGFQNAPENPFVDRFTNILPERVSATQWRCMQAQYARIPNYTTGSTPRGEPAKIAVAFDSSGGGMNMAVGGVVSSQGPLNNNYPGTNTLQLGRSLGASNWWNGTITQLTYYPTRLSNDELQVLTGGSPSGGNNNNNNNNNTTASVAVNSSSFTAGAAIGTDYYYNGTGCGGNNRSPQLSWSISNLPSGRSVSSWRLRCTDDDAPNFGAHWSVDGIQASQTSLAENGTWNGSPTVNATGFSPDAVRTNGWGGPCPPSQHTYRIVVTAVLDDNTTVASTALTFTAS